MSDNISIDDFNQNWAFFMREIEAPSWSPFTIECRFECSSFSCSGCNDWLDADRPNRKFQNWFRFKDFGFPRRLFHSSSNWVLKLKKAPSNQIWSKNLVKVALQRSSRPCSMEKMSPWSLSHSIKSKRIMSTMPEVMDVTNFITRKSLLKSF